MKTSELPDETIKAKDAILRALVLDVLPYFEPNYKFEFSPRDLSSLNWIFAEGLDVRINRDLLADGFPLLVGEVLTRHHGFQWVLLLDNGEHTAVQHKEFKNLVVSLDALDSWYKRIPADQRDEPPDLGDVMMGAYEEIVRAVHHQRIM